MRCVTSHLFRFLFAVRSHESDVTSSSDDSIGGPDILPGKSSTLTSIRICVWYLLTKLILKTWEQEGR